MHWLIISSTPCRPMKVSSVLCSCSGFRFRSVSLLKSFVSSSEIGKHSLNRSCKPNGDIATGRGRWKICLIEEGQQLTIWSADVFCTRCVLWFPIALGKPENPAALAYCQLFGSHHDERLARRNSAITTKVGIMLVCRRPLHTPPRYCPVGR